MAEDLRQRLVEAINEAFTSGADFDAGKAADVALAVVEGEALDRMAEHFINETKIRSMDFRNGMSMDLEPARELTAVWVGCARGMLGDAPNYSETPVTFTVSLAGEVEQYAFTLQRVGKLTPHQARQVAERERDEWRERAETDQAAVARVVAVHRVHNCEEDGHVLDRTPNPCVNDGMCSCGQPGDRCATRIALADLAEQA